MENSSGFSEAEGDDDDCFFSSKDKGKHRLI